MCIVCTGRIDRHVFSATERGKCKKIRTGMHQVINFWLRQNEKSAGATESDCVYIEGRYYLYALLLRSWYPGVYFGNCLLSHLFVI